MAIQIKPLLQSVAHGANLSYAIQKFGGARSEWLDLSSAVSPFSWWADNKQKVIFPEAVFQDLPSFNDELNQTIQAYYGIAGLAVAGSQAAIQVLPQCFTRATVWVLAGAYGEHAACWRAEGHTVVELTQDEIEVNFLNGTDFPDVLIVVNPGNPSGELFSSADLQQWAKQLAIVGGYLVCDEAFIDATPEQSILADDMPANMIVLRSLGKFFGLAGLRFGVLFASGDIRAALAQRIGPWPLAGASLWLAQQALKDIAWQCAQRQRLQECSGAMREALTSFNLIGSTSLFCTLAVPNVAAAQVLLAEHKIWTRCFRQQGLLRLWLAQPHELERLRLTLDKLNKPV